MNGKGVGAGVVAWSCAGLGALVILTFGVAAAAAAPPPPDEDPDAPKPGLLGSFMPRGTNEPAAVRIVTDLAARWGHGSPDARVPADGFRARYTGILLVQAPGTHRFFGRTDGSLRLTLAGRVVLEGSGGSLRSSPGDLPAGFAPLVLEYQHGEGDAHLAIDWEGPAPSASRCRAACCITSRAPRLVPTDSRTAGGTPTDCRATRSPPRRATTRRAGRERQARPRGRAAGDLALGDALLDPRAVRASSRHAEPSMLDDVSAARPVPRSLRRGRAWRDGFDVKLGRGIRDVELVVQTLQLLNGGQRPGAARAQHAARAAPPRRRGLKLSDREARARRRVPLLAPARAPRDGGDGAQHHRLPSDDAERAACAGFSAELGTFDAVVAGSNT